MDPIANVRRNRDDEDEDDDDDDDGKNVNYSSSVERGNHELRARETLA